jgi:hypothetical protein
VVLGEADMTSVLKRFKTYGKQADDLAEVDVSQLAVIAPTKRGDASVMMPKKKKK